MEFIQTYWPVFLVALIIGVIVGYLASSIIQGVLGLASIVVFVLALIY